MNISSLKILLGGTHPTTGLPFDADSQIASDQMNAENVDRLVPLLSTGLLAWSAGSSAGDRPRILKIKEGAASHASESVQAIATAADIMIQRENTVLDLNLPDRAAMVDALVSGGVLSAADSTSLYELATETISYAEFNNLSFIHAGHVEQARL